MEAVLDGLRKKYNGVYTSVDFQNVVNHCSKATNFSYPAVPVYPSVTRTKCDKHTDLSNRQIRIRRPCKSQDNTPATITDMT